MNIELKSKKQLDTGQNYQKVQLVEYLLPLLAIASLIVACCIISAKK